MDGQGTKQSPFLIYGDAIVLRFKTFPPVDLSEDFPSWATVDKAPEFVGDSATHCARCGKKFVEPYAAVEEPLTGAWLCEEHLEPFGISVETEFSFPEVLPEQPPQLVE